MYIRTSTEYKPIIRYAYFDDFDNWECSLEQAYKLYEENHLVHLYQDGIVKCYQEIKGLRPNEYKVGDLILTDFI